MRLSLPVHALMLLAAGVYGLPLAGLLSGALTANVLGAGDAATLAGAFAGGALAVLGLRRGSRLLEESALTQMKIHTLREEIAEDSDAL
jgi:positive regulator of sigma E activity